MAKLTSKQRNRLPASDFAEPKQRKYPVNNRSHAKNALARVAQHGTASEKAKVRKKVSAKYPSIAIGGKKTTKKHRKRVSAKR